MSKAESDLNVQHHVVMELLPWYVNGSLDAVNKLTVQLHLKLCLVCRNALKDLLFTSECVQSDVEASRFAKSLSRVMARIAADKSMNGKRLFPRLSQELWLKIRRFWWRFNRAEPQMKGLLIVQMAALLLVLSVLMFQQGFNGSSDEFRTLSSSVVAINPANSTRVHLVFSEGALETDIRRIVHRVDGNIVAGPSAAGVYTLILKGQEAKLAVEELKTEPKVFFVGPLLSADQ